MISPEIEQNNIMCSVEHNISFWRRMTAKIAAANSKKGPVT